jgi:hypothetical protein
MGEIMQNLIRAGSAQTLSYNRKKKIPKPTPTKQVSRRS